MESRFKGMTVNERLWEANLMEEYKKAVALKDIEEVKRLLKEVDLNEKSIEPILKFEGLI